MPEKKKQKRKAQISFFPIFFWIDVPKAGIFHLFVAGMGHSSEVGPFLLRTRVEAVRDAVVSNVACSYLAAQMVKQVFYQERKF